MNIKLILLTYLFYLIDFINNNNINNINEISIGENIPPTNINNNNNNTISNKTNNNNKNITNKNNEKPQLRKKGIFSIPLSPEGTGEDIIKNAYSSDGEDNENFPADNPITGMDYWKSKKLKFKEYADWYIELHNDT